MCSASRTVRSCVATGVAIALAGAFSVFCASALAQSSDTKPRIVCWKDKNGKTVGCGDKVPPEYQDHATREMDRSGITRGTTESTADETRRRAQDQEAAKVKAEEAKRMAEQKRQDSALLNTFTSEKEIDQKRDRDLQQADIQMSQMMVSLKNTTDRYAEVKARADVAAKGKAGVSAALKEELAKATSDKQRVEQIIATKEKEKEDIKLRYAEQRRRYLELRGEGPKATPTASGTR